MPFDVVSADRADLLLKALHNAREELIYKLSDHAALGNLLEEHLDHVVRKLADVQGCIEATKRYRDKT